ncbi:MAG TPA: glycosyltransferase family 2 protein [Thermoleophilaceae bacterium]|nr:glycosyltransferase family 2 protein [Thermoleophilaceae bacterium]
MAARPAVDVVVPFRGDAADRPRLDGLELREGDTLVVEDNDVTPGYGRNRGAARGSAEWLVFLDADVDPAPDLLDRYFEPEPEAGTALLAGAVEDRAGGSIAARYAHRRGLMSQENTLAWGRWAFAQTANAAVRRSAIEAVGGFREDIRAAEDADLAYRLKAAGWQMERRDGARAAHVPRASVRALLRQRMAHGAGGAWLDRAYPGSVPAKRWPGFVWWMARYTATGLARAARDRDPDRALVAILEPLDNLAYELGRSRSNERA